MATSSIPVCSQAPLGQSCCCCKRCGIGGCDLRLLDCGCCFHTRCFRTHENDSLTSCPLCNAPVGRLVLLPMAFDEIDQAQAQAASTSLSEKRGKKRKNATISRLNPVESETSELRTGRWTVEETTYCDKLIHYFEQGALPIPDGIKLNDFLSNMLKSKQSRLTKKMKNARLSARLYKRSVGYIVDDEQARQFSIVETEFFASIRCNMERSEIRFHMQKEWRELFSNYCVNIGQHIDANEWLHSVEELDRRASMQKDAARMARRKVMMGYALRQDSVNPPSGVFIDPSLNSISTGDVPLPMLKAGPDLGPSDVQSNRRKRLKLTQGTTRPPRFFSSAFIGKVIDYIQRHGVPFEHVDAWVPSFVPAPGETISGDHKCRLCFAGCGTTETLVPSTGGTPVPMSSEDQFDLLSFGEYSQKFSFDVGSGLPGRVYVSGVSSWEQGIQNAPTGLFERKGGAVQWGVETVLGIPIPSPNVGRIVILLYSRYDRAKNQDMVNRISDELAKLMPSPRWKLVVDVGMGPASGSSETTPDVEAQIRQLDSLIQAHIPADKNSPFAPLLPGFTSLRMLLVKRTRSGRENELLQAALESFERHRKSNQSDVQVASLVARDFMLLARQQLTPGAGSSNAPSASSKPTQVQPAHAVPGSYLQHQDCQAPHSTQNEPSLQLHLQQQQQIRAAHQQVATQSLNHQNGAIGTSLLRDRTAVGGAQPHNGNGNNNAMSPSLQALAGQGVASPSLHGIGGNGQNDAVPLNMTPSQLAALLQHDALNYQNS